MYGKKQHLSLHCSGPKLNCETTAAEMHASQWSSYHSRVLETKTSLADWAFHQYLAKILMMK